MLETASDYDASSGVPVFLRFITRLRAGIHRAAIAEKQKGFPSNPLTFFGRTQRELERTFRERKFPERITPAQFLAFLIGIAAVGNYFLNLGERFAGYAIKVAEKIGMKPPDREEQIGPWAATLMQRVFHVNPFAQTATNK